MMDTKPRQVRGFLCLIVRQCPWVAACNRSLVGILGHRPRHLCHLIRPTAHESVRPRRNRGDHNMHSLHGEKGSHRARTLVMFRGTFWFHKTRNLLANRVSLRLSSTCVDSTAKIHLTGRHAQPPWQTAVVDTQSLVGEQTDAGEFRCRGQ
jgi:hypothetical protein